MNSLHLFDHLKILYENELYSNAKTLAKMILSIYEQNRSFLSPQEHFCTLIYHAESLYNEHKYREAEVIFRQAMQARKVLKLKSVTGMSPKSLDIRDNISDFYTEVEIKYKRAKCLVELKNFRDAIAILQSLSSKQKSPKVNMMLSRLLHHHGIDRSSISAYKEVLKDCPLAFEAIEGLLSLGVKGAEVNTMVLDASTSPQCADWLSKWIKGHAHMYSRKYTEAIQAFKTIETTTPLKNYHQLLVLIGECHYHNGELDNAYTYLQRAHNLYPYMQTGIQILAMLLAKKNKIQSLEKMIAPNTTFPYEYTTEMWFVMAQYLFSSAKYDKAVYFVQKSCFLNPKNAEALILKARILVHLKKNQEAIAHLRFAQQFSPYRYEVHKGLVETFLLMQRYREAQAHATKALKQLGETPRLLTLSAKTFMKDLATKGRAKSLLLKALELNEYFLPAVVMLVDILQEDENDTAGAIRVLKKQLSVQPNCKLHVMLGDLLNNEKDQQAALEQYYLALNLDPSNRNAQNGIIAMGQTPGTDNSYISSATTEDGIENPLENIEILPNVPNDPESESDVMWSDVEIEMNS